MQVLDLKGGTFLHQRLNYSQFINAITMINKLYVLYFSFAIIGDCLSCESLGIFNKMKKAKTKRVDLNQKTYVL